MQDIDYIGEIQDGWRIARLKNIKADEKYSIVDGPFGSAISTLDYVDSGVPLIRITNLVDGRVVDNGIVYITEEHAKQLERSRVKRGDIIFAKTGGTVGKCAINDLFDYAILSSSCVKISLDDSYNRKYYYYYFSTSRFNFAIRNACNGTTRDTINLTPFSNLYCPLPKREVQDRIVDDLDTRCARIDDTIMRAKAIISECSSWKNSIVNDAITGKLDVSREMKDSNISWLGKIPATWRLIKLKYMFSIKKRIAGEEGYTVLSITQQGIVPKKMNEKGQFAMDYTKYQLVYKGDFAMNHMDLLTGWVDISEYDGVTSPDYRVFTLEDEKKCYPPYFKYIFQLCYKNKIFYGLGQGVAGFGRWRLPADMFLNFTLPVPEYDEQVRIVKYLDDALEKIDNVMKENEKLVADLESYKDSLIYSKTTGKEG